MSDDFLINIDKQLKHFSMLLVESITEEYKINELTKDQYVLLSQRIATWLYHYDKMMFLYQHFVQKIPVHFEIYPGVPNPKRSDKKEGN